MSLIAEPSPSFVLADLAPLTHRTNPAIIISNLLALLSSPPSATKKWLSPAVSSLLSSQLLRPNGVRALLLVVVGAGTQGGGEDEIGVKKLDMLSRLLVSKAPHISADVGPPSSFSFSSPRKSADLDAWDRSTARL